MKIIYNYEPQTKEYINSEEAPKNPLVEGEYLMPAHSTDVKPPKQKTGYTLVWIGNKWVNKEDHRGEIWYNLETKQKEVITFIGPIPKNYISEDDKRANPPEEPYYVYDAELNEWVGDSVLYKNYVLYNFETNWNTKLETPYEFEGHLYKPSWRDLYDSIYNTLKENVKPTYRLQDAKGELFTVNFKEMKPIYVKMANIVDEIYTDKQDLEIYFKIENDFSKLQEYFNNWVNKQYI